MRQARTGALKAVRGAWSFGAEAAVLAILAGLLLVAHRRAEAHVVLVVDGGLYDVHTRAPRVGSMLSERGIVLEPSDLVMPDAESHLTDGANVTVQRSRPAVVVADGERHHLRTHGRSAEDVLDAAGVTLGETDGLYVNGEPWPPPTPEGQRETVDTRVASIGNVALPRNALIQADGSTVAPETGLLPGDQPSWSIEVYRAVPITLIEDGLPVKLAVAGPSIAAALEAAGIPVHEQDGFSPAADTPVEPGLEVVVRRATPFQLEVDGAHIEARALAVTIGEALELTGYPLAGRDYSIPAATEALTPGAAVRIIRVTEDIEVAQVPIPFAVEKVADPGMDLDQTRVDRAGVAGLKTVKTRIVFENGTEVGREVLEEIVDLAPVPEIVAYGTNVVWNTVDTPEGPKRYWRKMRVYATSYSLSRSGTPKSSPWYGRTRLGWQMRRGVVSVDPRVVPMSSWLFVDGYGIGQAGDTGGGVKGYKIDLGYDDDNYESWHQYVDLYLLEPFPADFDMVWILP